MPQKSDLRRRDAGYRAPRLQAGSIKTSAGVFILKQGPQGLRSLRFPSKPGAFLDKKSFSRLLRMLQNRKLDLSGATPFQRKVYAALRKVPAGTTVTYGELARRAGFSGAARAVGSAMRKNRLPIVIPCHRVIRGSGALGQYSAGVPWKRMLLEFEGVEF